MKYEKIFSPINIGSMEVRNRFIVSAMATNYCNPDHTINEGFIDYWSARAQGGWGLLTVEATAIDPLGFATPRVPTLYDDRNISGFKKLADEVHNTEQKLPYSFTMPAGRFPLWP